MPSEHRAARSFVAAGSGEAREGGPSYEGRIIRRGDQSSEAMRDKACFVQTPECFAIASSRGIGSSSNSLLEGGGFELVVSL